VFVVVSSFYPSLMFVGNTGNVEVTGRDKRSSLLRYGVNYGRKNFYRTGLRRIVAKHELEVKRKFYSFFVETSKTFFV
jgi:hypothetical protein